MLDAGIVLVSVPPLICAGLVYCQCIGRWTVLDNIHAKGCCTATTMVLTAIKQKPLSMDSLVYHPKKSRLCTEQEAIWSETINYNEEPSVQC